MVKYAVHYEIRWHRKFDRCWASRTYLCDAVDDKDAIDRFWRTHKSGDSVRIEKVEQL